MDFKLDLVGGSPVMQTLEADLRQLLKNIRRSKAPPIVLLRGEPGTGKTRIARSLHKSGPRAQGELVEADCTSIPETLFEASMLGHKKGAFTDAHQDAPGYFAQAHAGTLFLDEIGKLSLPEQAVLLRPIEDRKVGAVGGPRPRSIDLWLVAAASEPLEDMVQSGRYLPELWYRLRKIQFVVPALRDRGSEYILTLAERFAADLAERHGLLPRQLTSEALRLIASWQWPGNVRELEGVIEASLLLSPGETIGGDLVRRAIYGDMAPSPLLPSAPASNRRAKKRESELAEIRAICGLARTATEAAEIYGAPRSTFESKLRSLGVGFKQLKAG